MSDLAAMAWPLIRLPEAIESLARRARLRPTLTGAVPPPTFRGAPSPEDLNDWLQQAAVILGVEVESVDASGAEVVNLLRRAGPALLRYGRADEHGVLLLLRANARTVKLLSPDLRAMDVPIETVRAALCAQAEGAAIADVESLLHQTNIGGRHRDKVKRMMVRGRVEGKRIAACWLLRIPPAANFRTQVANAGIPGRLIMMLVVFTTQFALEIAGWAVIGGGALSGRLDFGWLLAWALLLLGAVPLRLTGNWLQGTLSIAAGTLLKQRLLSGALNMGLHEARLHGVGQWLSRVIESEALETLTLSGGFSVLVAMLELSLAAWVLALGAGGLWHVVLLLAWLIVAAIVANRYYRRLRIWTRARLDLTHDLIERMVGHRTRMVQQAPEHRHADEDRQLDRYVNLSRDFDRLFVPLAAGLPRGWLIVGLLGLSPAFVTGTAAPTGLAVGLGGVLLGFRALSTISAGLASLLRAAVAARETAPLFVASQEGDSPADGLVSVQTNRDTASAKDASVLVQARDVVFRHRPQGAPVLEGCSFTFHRGDRLLLEGPSGGGKSTLASLLVGLRRAQSGLLLLDGLDRASLGDTWRRMSTSAPQFHENYVLTGTLAFNLLMGRHWPPDETDLATATQVCRELGLGELLERMPLGLMQMVGETGWQLSHGERSRLYLARALLQHAELVVLDESFAALDPQTLDRCVRCALTRAPTLLVIAHP
jgi:ATP-binding cassette subfamily B protein